MARTLAKLTGVLPDPTEGESTSLLRVSSRKIGIEFELENIHKNYDTSLYPLLRFSTDNSLRNNGIEITTLPVKGSNIILALEQFNQWMKDSNNHPICSDRTGLHVHIDMRDADVKQLIKVITTYLTVEDILFQYCGEERKQNPYCIPLSNCVGEFSEYKLRDLQSTSDAKVMRAIDRHVKYSALNLRPLLSYGTIEFRLHKGTYDTEKILLWINILLSVVTFGLETKGTPQDIIDAICLDTDGFIDQVFSGYLPIPNEELYDSLLYGARQAQHLYRHRDQYEATTESLFNALYNQTNPDTELDLLIEQIESIRQGNTFLSADFATSSRTHTS